jgi:hypothetical protein
MAEVQKMQEQFSASPSMDKAVTGVLPSHGIHSIRGDKKSPHMTGFF